MSDQVASDNLLGLLTEAQSSLKDYQIAAAVKDNLWDRIRKPLGAGLAARGTPGGLLLGSILGGPRAPSDIAREKREEAVGKFSLADAYGRAKGRSLENTQRENEIARQPIAAKADDLKTQFDIMQGGGDSALVEQILGRKPYTTKRNVTIPGSGAAALQSATNNPVLQAMAPNMNLPDATVERDEPFGSTVSPRLIHDQSGFAAEYTPGRPLNVLNQSRSVNRADNAIAIERMRLNNAKKLAKIRGKTTDKTQTALDKRSQRTQLSAELTTRLAQQKKEKEAVAGGAGKTDPVNDESITRIYEQLAELDGKTAKSTATATDSGGWTDLGDGVEVRKK